MSKHKYFISLAAIVAVLAVSANLPTVFAESITEDNLNPTVVQQAIKPTLMSQKYQAAQNAENRAASLDAAKAEQARVAKVAADKKAADEKAAAEKKQQEQAAANNTASSSVSTASSTPSYTSAVSKGTFKLSFYDPAVLGSSMGYGGVAANLSVFPRGTQLKITLSDGTVWYRVVNDTGSFAYSNPNQLDVAMPNSQIPSAGILYAQVEVVS